MSGARSRAESGEGGVRIRPAVRGDGVLIHGFIRDLARYERLEHALRATPEDVDAALFGEPARAFCDIAEIGPQAVGFALWFYNFSTFEGRAGLYLEDLYVRPEARGQGAGKALLAGLARRCVAENLGRLDWAVLNWNAPSIAFYDNLGALVLDDWTTRRLAGEPLRRLAGTE